MATIKQYIQELKRQRNTLADSLAAQDVIASRTEKLNTLVPKVLDIDGGGAFLAFHRCNNQGVDIPIDTPVSDSVYFRSDCALDPDLSLGDFTTESVAAVQYQDALHLKVTLISTIETGDTISITAKPSAFLNKNGDSDMLVFEAIVESMHEDEYYQPDATGKYAVSVFDIGSDGIGLIFGPAMGGNWTSASKPAHVSAAEETSSNRCIHNHSWDEIIAFQNEDPHCFDGCIAGHCTKTVLLSGGMSQFNTGDGASVIGGGKNDLYQWNSAGGNTGGYEASTVRQTLREVILPFFPSNVRNATAFRPFKAYGSSGIVTLQDKLWLFAFCELYPSAGDKSDGSIMASMKGHGWGDTIRSLYYSTGTNRDYAWTRTPRSSNIIALHNTNYNDVGVGSNQKFGLPVGFALSRET